jgi:large subunit ribosomal protein L10
MSKYVKKLVTEHVRKRLNGVGDALLVNMIGLEANANNRLRNELQQKNIQLLVIKNSSAAQAVAGTPLAPAFEGLTGTAAICWGGQDLVSLAKEVVRLARQEQYAAFQVRGGAMDGERLSPEQVQEVARWPSREEQLGILVGQILGPGSQLSAQLLGPGGQVASQISEKGKGSEEEPAAEKGPQEEPAAEKGPEEGPAAEAAPA